MLNNRFIRFLLVGALNSLVGYGLFSLLIYSGLHYALATLIATILCVFFNFFTTGGIVFNTLDKKHLARFILVYSFLYILNIVLLKLLIHSGLNAYLAGFLLIPVMAILGYTLQSRFTFRSDR